MVVGRTGRREVRKEQMSLAALLPPGTAALPEDFPARLDRIKDSSGLSWNALAEKLGVDPRQIWRWRQGIEPTGGAMLALIEFAMLLPGGHQMLFANGHPVGTNRPPGSVSNGR